MTEQQARATIYDVAVRAGVSHQTVARMLRGETVRPDNRDRIAVALRELNYRPNEEARALARNRSNRIGVLGGHISDGAPAKILAGANRALREAGFVLDTIAFDPDNVVDTAQAVQAVERSHLAGVLVIAPTDIVVGALDLTRLGIPVAVEADIIDNRRPDFNASIALAVEHLLALGHRRFLHIAGPQNWPSARHRRQVVDDVLARNGASATTAFGDWSAESGALAAAQLPDEATAVVSANDLMALGAMSVFFARGLDVPGDVSITGFDGDPDTEFWRPPLTTVAVDYLASGRYSAEFLLSLIEGAPEPAPLRPPHLIVRESTAPVRPRTRIPSGRERSPAR